MPSPTVTASMGKRVPGMTTSGRRRQERRVSGSAVKQAHNPREKDEELAEEQSRHVSRSAIRGKALAETEAIRTERMRQRDQEQRKTAKSKKE